MPQTVRKAPARAWHGLFCRRPDPELRSAGVERPDTPEISVFEDVPGSSLTGGDRDQHSISMVMALGATATAARARTSDLISIRGSSNGRGEKEGRRPDFERRKPSALYQDADHLYQDVILSLIDRSTSDSANSPLHCNQASAWLMFSLPSMPSYRSIFRPGLFAGQVALVTGGGSRHRPLHRARAGLARRPGGDRRPDDGKARGGAEGDRGGRRNLLGACHATSATRRACRRRWRRCSPRTAASTPWSTTPAASSRRRWRRSAPRAGTRWCATT